MNRATHSRRRGTVYIAVLAVAMIVVLIGVTGIAVARSQKRAVDALGNAAEARFYALAGIEVGRVWISQNSNWRTAYTASLFANQPVGAGTYTLTMVNGTGVVSLDNTPSDPVVLTSTGAKGSAKQIISVTMGPVAYPSTCLTAALVSGGALSISSTVQPASQIVASNTSITANNGSIFSDVETVGSYTGGNYYGQTTSGIPALTLPDSTVWSYYQTYGTVIPTASISAAGWKLQNILLSPASNPVGGGTNTRGIYIIDCQNNNFTINTCRIVGTLVLLNGHNVTIQNQNNITPAVSNLPALMIQATGSVNFQMNTSALNESGGTGNLNPPGTPYPYPSGTSNTTTTDTYPSIIDGLVYVSGSATISNNCSIDMLIVSGTLSVNNSVTLNYNPTLLTNPPPGFGTISMTVQPGTFTQIVN